MSSSSKRPYDQALAVAERILTAVTPYCERAIIAGSIRRKRPMIGDIEIVALPVRQSNLLGETQPDLPTSLDRFFRQRGVRLLVNGPLYKRFRYDSWNVCLFLPASHAHWGSILTIRTGSKEFNHWLLKHAKGQGVKFSEGLLLDWQANTIPTHEEIDVFKACSLPWIPVNMRDSYSWLKYLEGSKNESSN